MSEAPPRRARTGRAVAIGALAVGVLIVALLIAMVADAHRLRAAASTPDAVRDRAAIVGLAGVTDLAVSSSSRWLRHPSVSEPGAAFSDAPAMFDTDPAGAAVPLPRTLYRGASRTKIDVRRRSTP